jgi:L-phenylalanine/L-methionine N-acetyltransferase
MSADPTSEAPAPQVQLPAARRPAAAANPGLTIRAAEPGDWQEVADLMALPKVRFGTLRMPYASREETKAWLEKPADGVRIVAVLDGRIVGTAGFVQYKGRRSHAAGIGLSVHDDYHGRGIGAALLAALVDAADNWLNLKRLELTVYVDNVPAIDLYKKYGFVIEGTRRADAFRDGEFADSYEMARVRGV